MPEINEVRKYADFIRKKLINKIIINIKILNGRYKKHGPFENYTKLKKNMPLKLIDVKTKGKLIYLIFDNNLYLINTLGLTGGWCFLRNKSNIYEHTDIYKNYLKNGDKKLTDIYIKNSLNHLNFEIRTMEGILYY